MVKQSFALFCVILAGCGGNVRSKGCSDLAECKPPTFLPANQDVMCRIMEVYLSCVESAMQHCDTLPDGVPNMVEIMRKELETKCTKASEEDPAKNGCEEMKKCTPPYLIGMDDPGEYCPHLTEYVRCVDEPMKACDSVPQFMKMAIAELKEKADVECTKASEDDPTKKGCEEMKKCPPPNALRTMDDPVEYCPSLTEFLRCVGEPMKACDSVPQPMKMVIAQMKEKADAECTKAAVDDANKACDEVQICQSMLGSLARMAGTDDLDVICPSIRKYIDCMEVAMGKEVKCPTVPMKFKHALDGYKKFVNLKCSTAPVDDAKKACDELQICQSMLGSLSGMAGTEDLGAICPSIRKYIDCMEVAMAKEVKCPTVPMNLKQTIDGYKKLVNIKCSTDEMTTTLGDAGISESNTGCEDLRNCPIPTDIAGKTEPDEICPSLQKYVRCVSTAMETCDAVTDQMRETVAIQQKIVAEKCDKEPDIEELEETGPRLHIDVLRSTSTSISIRLTHDDRNESLTYSYKVLYRRVGDEAINMRYVGRDDWETTLDNLFPDTRYEIVVKEGGTDIEGRIYTTTKEADFPEETIIQDRSHTEFIIMEKTALSLFCGVKGVPKPEVTWLNKHNRTIPKGSRGYDVIDVLDGSVLRIAAARFRKDKGIFSCVASNGVGQPANARYNITVIKGKRGNDFPILTEHPESLTIDQGREFSLHCVSKGGHDGTAYWWKDGNIVEGSLRKIRRPPRESGTIGGTLRIAYALPEDTGDYRCVVRDDRGFTVESKKARINVNPKLVPPFIIEGPKNLTVMSGLPFSLTCDAGGDPLPKVDLYERRKDSLARFGFSYHTIATEYGRNVVHIAGIDRTTEYQCMVWSVVGSITRDVTVTVTNDAKATLDVDISTGRTGIASLDGRLRTLVSDVKRTLEEMADRSRVGAISPVIINVLNINTNQNGDQPCASDVKRNHG